MRIDAHQHFWLYTESMTWITPAMSTIAKNFLPADLAPLLRQQAIDGCVAVQADQHPGETDFLLELAVQNPFIKGVVGWVDLRSPDISAQLSAYAKHPLLKGFRHVLQSEPPAYMLDPAFVSGLRALHRFGFTYDILVYPEHLPAVRELLKQLPEQPFVLDHMAKPPIRDKHMDNWEVDIRAIAAYENVYCKVSGMVTEAGWADWTDADFIPYLDVITGAFGTHRLMYGSDWPVCLVAASYGETAGIVKTYFASFPENEQQAVWGDNAARFYHLS